MKTDQEIFELRGKIASEFFKFSNECTSKYEVNEEFMAFTLLTYAGCFLGGRISRKDALKAFNMGFEMGEKITEHSRA